MIESKAHSATFNNKKLFAICALALFTASMGLSLRAAIALDLKTGLMDTIDIAQSGVLLAKAMGVAFLGFAFTLFVISPLLNVIGLFRTLFGAALLYLLGTALVVAASILSSGYFAYNTLWFGMLLAGIAWGATEAAVNPLTTTLYPEDKTHRLNVVHAWWPAGLIVGGVSGVLCKHMGLSWQLTYALALIPAAVLLVMVIGTIFPRIEHNGEEVGIRKMLTEIFRQPVFLIWFGAMFLTAASELAPGQWVDLALTEKVGFRGIWLLIYISGLMFVMRHFAGTLAHRLSNIGLLWFSSLFAAAGLFLLSRAENAFSAFSGATLWGIGVCFMWPTMLSSVAERYPQGGAWFIGLMGSAGALSIHFVLPQLGAYYDKVKIDMAGGADALLAISAEKAVEIESLAASQSFSIVALFPLVLLVVFLVLWLAEKARGSRADI